MFESLSRYKIVQFFRGFVQTLRYITNKRQKKVNYLKFIVTFNTKSVYTMA